MPAVMLCKIPIKSSGEPHRSIGKRKTKYACIVDDDESARPRLEGAGQKPHQDHITAKGMNSITHTVLFTSFSFAKSNENTGCEGCSGQGVKNLRKYQHGS